MTFWAKGYERKAIIASVANSRDTVKTIIKRGFPVLNLVENFVQIPGETPIPITIVGKSDVSQVLVDYDVIEINEKGVAFVLFSALSNSNAIFITGKCNSNCRMCPNSETLRRKSAVLPINYLCDIIEQIPSDACHLTISGGEPFLLRDDFFRLMDKLNKHLPNTPLQLLSNGRALANQSFASEFSNHVTNFWSIAVPIHASTNQLHDYITQNLGSFTQSIIGLKKIAHTAADIEIRVVVSKINYENLIDLAKFLVFSIPRITRVNFIGLEMLGNAMVNASEIWIDYREAFPYIKEAIDFLIRSGTNTGLYNLPLCAVDQAYWGICKRSISDYKVNYSEECMECSVKSICGGYFLSTHRFGKFKVKPIVRGLSNA